MNEMRLCHLRNEVDAGKPLLGGCLMLACLLCFYRLELALVEIPLLDIVP